MEIARISIEAAQLMCLLVIVWMLSQNPRSVSKPSSFSTPAQTDSVQLLVRQNGQWVHHSWRPEGHPDVNTALDTPGLAIARDGVMELGKQ